MTSRCDCTGGVHFLAIIMQIPHDVRDTMIYYWSSVEQFFIPFYTNMICDWFLHVLRFLHFSANMKQLHMDDNWKVRCFFN
jgi:hypothetical protein